MSNSHLPPLAPGLTRTASAFQLPKSVPKGSNLNNSLNLSMAADLSDLKPMGILKKNAERRLRQTLASVDLKALNRTFTSPGGEIVDGLSELQLRMIYQAKCEDIDIQMMPLQEKRFIEYCCKYLKKRDFNLAESGIGPAAGKAIAECVRNNPAFSKLSLSKNVLGDFGAIQLTHILSKALNIMLLDISSNGLSPEGAVDVLNELMTHESIVSLNLSSHEGLHRNRLGVPGAKAVSDLLARNNLLMNLNVAGTAIGSDGLEEIAQGLATNRTLLFLNLANNAIQGKAMDQFMQAVNKSNLTHLNLSYNSLSNSSADALAAALASDDGTECKLKSLDLSGAKLGFAASTKVFTAMTRNTSLSTLILEKNPIGAQVNVALTHCISDNMTLRHLDLTNCGLRANGAAVIGEGLAKNHSLQVLLIGSNFFEVLFTQEEFISALAAGLNRNSALTHLDLSNNRITDRGGVMICNALRSHAAITQLMLNDNEIREQTAQQLADMTRTRRNLIRVNIKNNPLSYKYVIEIRNNVALNLKFQGMNRAPGLIRELRELELQDTDVNAINQNIEKLQSEAATLQEQVDRHSEKYSLYQKAEEAKTQAVLKEGEIIMKRREEVNLAYYEVMQELQVRG